MKLIIGCDEAALELKNEIKAHVEGKGIACEDVGVYDHAPVLYPDIAARVAEKIADGTYERGILLCGTGIGMAITANKVPGVRAAVCHDMFSAKRSRMSNNAQIMCLGAWVIGPALAKDLVDVWLESEFAGGRSAEKVERIAYYEQKYK